MVFNPASGNHAIAEVVFGLSFSRPFAPPEIERVAKSHSRWKDELPRLNRMGGMPFMLSEPTWPQNLQLGGGISFERIKPDGSLDWRLLVDQNNIFVNCLSYTRWVEVWPRAKKYIEEVIEVASAGDALIVSATLQYIDMFIWSASPEEYDARLLMREGDYVPPAVFSRGHLWHLYQGWFEPAQTGRILERVHIDAVEQDGVLPVVKFDIYMQDQLGTFYTPSEAINGGWLEATFDGMHQKNKRLLESFITPEMATRIDLNVA